MEGDIKVGYLFYVRHGERADDKKVKEKDRIKVPEDCPLSLNGHKMCEDAGKKINEYLTGTLHYEGKVTIVSSPFI